MQSKLQEQKTALQKEVTALQAQQVQDAGEVQMHMAALGEQHETLISQHLKELGEWEAQTGSSLQKSAR